MYWINETDTGRLYSNSKQIPFYCDEDSDVSMLPTESAPGVQQGEDTVSCRPCGKGSQCLSIGSGSLYILNSRDEWKQI